MNDEQRKLLADCLRGIRAALSADLPQDEQMLQIVEVVAVFKRFYSTYATKR